MSGGLWQARDVRRIDLNADARTKFLAFDRDSIVAFEVDKLDAGRGSDIRKLDRGRRRLRLAKKDGADGKEQ